MVCRNFDKICISLKMGCYPVKVSATYIRDELNFQSDAQIYKKTVIIREKNCYKLFGEKTNVKASQCYHYFELRRGFRTMYNSQYWSTFRMQCQEKILLRKGGHYMKIRI